MNGPAFSARHRRGRRAPARDSDGWTILLGFALVTALAFGLWGPWPTASPKRARAVALSMAQARASNAAVPIDRARRGQARPFRFVGGPAAREQATDCLATAALYEAGDDAPGRRAVMQVILNRVRTPPFPATVCGVVYQGYQRRSGCQFSFTCDHSFDRRPIHDGWAQARREARRALAGHVFAAVGRATDYHADWVVPYWRDTMAKVARVGAHLFYARRTAPPPPVRDDHDG